MKLILKCFVGGQRFWEFAAAPQRAVGTLKRQIPKAFRSGQLAFPGVMEAEACPRGEESPGEPPPRDHWHVRISLIGLCLIFTDDSHSFPPPPQTSRQRNSVLLLLPQTKWQSGDSSELTVTSLSEGGERLRNSFEVSATPLWSAPLKSHVFVFLDEQLQNKLTPAGLWAAASNHEVLFWRLQWDY